MKKDTTLLIRINDNLKKEIQRIADKNEVSVSEIINVCLIDIARKGDLNMVQKSKLGIFKDETLLGKITIIDIKKVVEEAIKELELQSKIKKVYLFGSFARGEETPSSDIDLRLEDGNDMSSFDIGNLRYQIKEKTGRNVDITDEDLDKMDPVFYSNLKKDEICIYE